jgi:phage-related protein
MALVGSANIVIRAITINVERDISKGFANVGRTGRRAGESMSQAFTRGFNSSNSKNIFKKLSDGIGTAASGAESARRTFSNLSRTFQFVATGISVLIGGIAAVIGGLGSLIGVAGGAAASLSGLGNVMFSLVAAMVVARLALSGVGKALSALQKPSSGGGGGAGGEAAVAAAKAAAAKAVQNAEQQLALTIEQNRENLVDANNSVRDAQLELNKALAEGREEIQQLGFDAEDAALSEKKAALDLEKARIALAKAQDLPPNSRARQEAELAYQEAELNLRKAKDRSADLNAEQDKLAKTGVRGTSVVISATNALAQAEANRAKIVRDALRSETKANDDLADAKNSAATAGDSAGASGGGGANPFEGLNQAQIDFVNYLNTTVMPLITTLKASAANALLPLLTTAINILATGAFETINVGVSQIATALGSAAISVANAITETANLVNLGSLFTSSSALIVTFGDIIGNVWGIFLSIMTRVAPYVQGAADALEEATARFDAFLKAPENNNSIEDFFQRSAAALAQFGEIFKNIFGGFGAIINANLGPGTGGQLILDWLTKVTGGFNDLDSNVSGQTGLKNFFLAIADNATKVLDAVGLLAGGLLNLGANPAVGETFEKLGQSAPAVIEIFNKLVDAGPSFADFVAHVSEVINLLTDSDTTTTFFDTLTVIVKALEGFLSNPFVQAVLDALAPLQGFLLAIGGITSALILGRLVLLGYSKLALDAAKSVKNLFSAETLGFIKSKAASAAATAKRIGDQVALTIWYGAESAKRLAIIAAENIRAAALWVAGNAKIAASFIAVNAALIAQKVALIAGSIASGVAAAAQWALNAALTANPIGIIVAAIAALVAGLIWFFTQTELGQDIWKNFTQFITDAVTNIGQFFSTVFGAIGQFFVDTWTNISNFFQTVWDAIVFIATTYINTVLTIITTVVDVITTVWNTVWTAISDFFSGVWQAIVDFVTSSINTVSDIIKNVTDFISDVWNTAWTGISDFFSGIWNGVVDFFSGIVNTVKDYIDNFIRGFQIFLDFLPKIGDGFRNVFNGVRDFMKGIVNGIIGLVEGMVNGIIDAINGIIGGINAVAGAIGNAIGIKLRVPTIGGVSLPRLADGGTVFPSPGGSIVNVAEAGRPERIEPLDEDGLSKRDKAIMSLNAGVTINVTQLPNENGEELAERISRIISFRQNKWGLT